MIIGICGTMGEGKDTVAKIITNLYPSFEVVKYAGPLKEITAILGDTDVANLEDEDFKNSEFPLKIEHPLTGHLMSFRDFLAYVGTELFRERLDPDFWIKATLNKVTNDKDIVITDVRFPNEVKAIQDRGGKVIRVFRAMTVEDWLRTSYIKPFKRYLNKYIRKKDPMLLDKSEVLALIKEELGNRVIPSELQKQWHKLTSSSENSVFSMDFLNMYDGILRNDSTLEDLKESLISLDLVQNNTQN